MIKLPANFLQRLLEITLEDFIYIVASMGAVAFIVGFVLAGNPQFDAQYRFVLRDGLDAFGDNESADLAFTEEQFQTINDISGTSWGPEAEGDERLFCFKVNDGVVTEFRFVDNVSESTRTSISGECTSVYSNTRFDGFLHTQPDYSSSLSEEDKDIESPESVRFTCISYDRVVLVNGEVGGLNCWEITGPEDDLKFTEIELGVTSKPDLIPSLQFIKSI